MKRGRPKGYSPYVEISYEDLADYVGRKTLIKVCKTWIEDPAEQAHSSNNLFSLSKQSHAEDVHEEEANQEQPKIEYAITNFNE